MKQFLKNKLLMEKGWRSGAVVEKIINGFLTFKIFSRIIRWIKTLDNWPKKLNNARIG